MKESEALLKRTAEILGVPVNDVPKAVKNILNEVNELDTQIKQLSQ